MKVCFIPSGPIEWASARLRAFWVAPYMEDATVMPLVGGNVRVPWADVYIWHKQVHLDFIKESKSWARHYWDVCDPTWWFSPQVCRELLPLMDGVVVPTFELAEDLHDWADIEATIIPDRLELSHFTKRREHQDVKPVRFIWFGMYVNRVALAGAWAYLTRLKMDGYDVSLTILDDQPGIPLGYGSEIPIYYTQWTLDTEVEIIAQHDIALLPPYPGPWGRMKSDNKAKTAWACGLPIAKGFGYAELVDLVQRPALREAEARNGLDCVFSIADVRHSADDWERLLCQS